MGSGKTTILLQLAHNYRERNLVPILLLPAICNTEYIESRIGITAKAHVFGEKDSIAKLLDAPQFSVITCVMVDESQFMTASQVHELNVFSARFNIPVYCFGIRTDFKGNLFPGSAALLAVADEMIQTKSLCHCGKYATMNARINEAGNILRDGPTIQIEKKNSYVSLCRNHWLHLTDICYGT